jgi:molybdopterin-binding protein
VADFVGVRNFFRGELVENDGGTGKFRTGGTVFTVVTDQKPGSGNVIIDSTDITVSEQKVSTSARNVLEGRVTDFFPAGHGMEVIVDAGVKLAATVTEQSFRGMNMERGARLFVSIKASAIRFMRM